MTTSLGKSCTPTNTRLYAVGDVHGYLDLLQRLHGKITADLEQNPVDSHKIIFVGDYIDRGPDSAGCVEYLINLVDDDHDVICLKGNHEAKLLEFLVEPFEVADSFFTYGGKETATSYGVDMTGYHGISKHIQQKFKELKNNIPNEHKVFFAKLKTTVTFGDYLFTHAGVRPGVALDKQTEHDLTWIRYEFISNESLYDKVIVHGHTPTYPMEILPNRINVDIHAYHTGILGCIVLEGSDYRVIES